MYTILMKKLTEMWLKLHYIVYVFELKANATYEKKRITGLLLYQLVKVLFYIL